MKKLLLSLLLWMVALTNYAQDIPATSSFTLQIGADGVLQIGETTLPDASLTVDWNPQGANSWARVDEYGMLRFAPIGSPEGVYSFAPYFAGFTTPSRDENRLYVDEVAWSPNGQQLAFRISSGNEQGNDGVWFWQPAQETVTDPSYHLLRDCPPGCGLTNSRDTAEWKSLSMDWSPDNVAILTHLYLPEENRNAIGLVFASRDPESPQADIQPPTYRYEYGAWATDGQQLVVSGYDENGTSVFGFINRDGSNPRLTPSQTIGLTYVRNAVQSLDGNHILMLGSSAGMDAPVTLYRDDGIALTPAIGTHSPDSVTWNPQHTAVLVESDGRTYVATINGDVHDITDMVGGNPMVSWVEGEFPANTRIVSMFEPTPITATATPITITIPAESIPLLPVDQTAQPLTAPLTSFVAGQLLEVSADSVILYREPIVGAEVVSTLPQGTALVLISQPLTDGTTIWWRVQTLDFVGWAQESVDGISQFSS